jgi:hypothetical protein
MMHKTNQKSRFVVMALKSTSTAINMFYSSLLTVNTMGKTRVESMSLAVPVLQLYNRVISLYVFPLHKLFLYPLNAMGQPITFHRAQFNL